MKWERRDLGWWEAQGQRYRYRAIQAGSHKWELMVFANGLEATADYPVTLADCKYYAEQVENGSYRIRSGSLARV